LVAILSRRLSNGRLGLQGAIRCSRIAPGFEYGAMPCGYCALRLCQEIASMNNKNIPRKHHFLPQFYLKGFYNDDKKFFIYNKKLDSVSNNPATSAREFYIDDFHTLNLLGRKFVKIEQFYGELESGWAQVFSKIASADDPARILEDEYGDKILKLFIAVQFWRSPFRQDLSRTMSESLPDIFEVAHKTNHELIGRNFDRKLLKLLMKMRNEESVAKVIQFMVMPLITFDFSLKPGFRFSLLGKDEEFQDNFICTDNPIVFSEVDAFFKWEDRFYLPFSKNFLLTSNVGPSAKDDEGLRGMQKNLFLTTQNKAIASSKEILQGLKESCIKEA
jgi:hypothetical protein